MLETFPNRHEGRDYVVVFDYPEFTSLCPVTGQPDYGTIRICYAPAASCVESKSFKLYMGAFRNCGAFVEELVNRVADDLVAVLKPRRMTVEGHFNARGGTSISVRAEYMDHALPEGKQAVLAKLW
jgi:7-cyano-7-deazaguanine reductase